MILAFCIVSFCLVSIIFFIWDRISLHRPDWKRIHHFNILLKYKVSSETQGSLLSVTPIRSKSKLHTSTIRWHGIFTTIKNGRNENIMNKSQTSSWPKSSSRNSKFTDVCCQHAYMALVCQFCCLKIHTKLWMLPCFVSKSLWQISHGYGISNTLPSSTKLRVCFPSFIQWYSMPTLQGLLCHKPGIQGTLVSGRKIPWSLNCCVLHNLKGSTMLLTLPSSVTQLEWNLPTLNHVCNNFFFLSFSIKIKFLGNFFSGYGLDLRAPLPLFQCYSVPSLMMLLS